MRLIGYKPAIWFYTHAMSSDRMSCCHLCYLWQEAERLQTVVFSVSPTALSCVTKGPGDTQLHFGRAIWKECKMSSGKPVGI